MQSAQKIAEYLRDIRDELRALRADMARRTRGARLIARTVVGRLDPVVGLHVADAVGIMTGGECLSFFSVNNQDRRRTIYL